MNIIFRYISMSFIKLFVICNCSFLLVYLTIDFMGQFWKLSARGIPLPEVSLYFTLKIPLILSQITPMATLLSTLLTLGLLSRNSEITIMKSCGISIFYISVPILALSLLISVFSLGMNEYLLPHTNKKVKEIERYRPGRVSSKTFIKRNEIWYFGKSNIVNIDLLVMEEKQLRGVTILQLGKDKKVKRRIDAKKARWDSGKWLFSEGVIRHFENSLKVETFREKEIPLEEKFSDFTVVVRSSEEMTFRELKKHIEKLKHMGLDYNRYMVDLMAKIAFPLVNFILPLLGIPFALKTGRSAGIAAGVGISIVIGFSYWVTMAFNISLGHAALLPPFFAAFGSNIIFTLAGIIALLNVKS
ncbi:MAG: LPS export ABC transporter permease LptG [Deltaproteobacteria bacterium]|nr:LPS export ABC transporter permease LptG [Deltaproteobacteria bacterium]